MESYSGQLKTAEYQIEKYRSHHDKNKNKIYCNDIFCFDIETTSAWYDGKKVVPYMPGLPAEYWNSLVPLALPYIAMFSLNDKVYYVREFSDIKLIFDDIPTDYYCIIWVHNLAYEFQFLNNIFTWDSVFARSPHKVIKCIPHEYPNIEFRCTYFLTRLSLDAWSKQNGVLKKTGQLDYDKIRTPLSQLNITELEYCEYDLLAMYAGLKKQYIPKYGTPRNIPLTQTGTVRREVKKMLCEDIEYMRHVHHLVPNNAKEYDMLIKVFAGGYTHANRMYSGMVQRGIIEHYDFASSYPYVMLSEKFPDTVWTYCYKKEMPDKSTFSDIAYIMRLEFTALMCETCNTYIQASKCVCTNARYDNGRVIYADKLIMTMTEQDYLTISETYSWDSVNVIYVYKAEKRYLPRQFLEYILELYANKTELKDVPEKEEIYMQAKQYINALFGMMVMRILQSDVIFDGKDWIVPPLTEEAVNKHLHKLMTFKRDKRYFLSYSYGIYVTAYARRNLWLCMTHDDNDSNVIYVDTDSIFIHGRNNFDWYNRLVDLKIRASCKANKLDYSKTKPKTPAGKEKPIGVFSREDDCSEFITLGAKRYCERRVSDGKLHLTISGINKDAVAMLNDDIENFKDGFVFCKDNPSVRKKLLTYLDNMPDVKYPDGYISKYRYGINMRNNGYKLSITDEYANLINYLRNPDDRLSVTMRGMFTLKGSEEDV